MTKFSEPFPTDDPDALSPELQRELDNFPGNALKADGRRHVRLLFFQLPEAPEDGKKFLRELVRRDLLTTALRQCGESKAHKAGFTSGAPFRSLALTAKGFKRLDGNDDSHKATPLPGDSIFEFGMKDKSELADLGDNLGDWQEKYSRQSFHGVWLLAHRRAAEADALAEKTTRFSRKHGVRIVARESAKRQDVEPFGFRDGLSAPKFFANLAPRGPENWPTVFPLNSVLYSQNPNPLFALKEIDLTVFNGGSFLVVRKLEQDVAAFAEATAKIAGPVRRPGQSSREAADYAGALIVGRHKDGTPLMPSPDRNNFNYANETTGAVCPFHAHIRKANPREVFAAGKVNSMRILARRGAVYKEEVRGRAATGLLFMAYCGSLGEGFKFVQNAWMNAPSFTAGVQTTEQGTDALVGQPPSAALIAGPLRCPGLRRFVTPRGGEYFFVPPMSWLKTV